MADVFFQIYGRSLRKFDSRVPSFLPSLFLSVCRSVGRSVGLSFCNSFCLASLCACFLFILFFFSFSAFTPRIKSCREVQLANVRKIFHKVMISQRSTIIAEWEGQKCPGCSCRRGVVACRATVGIREGGGKNEACGPAQWHARWTHVVVCV